MVRQQYIEITKFSRLQEIFSRLGVSHLLLKIMSPNDNSKNQVYLGSDFQALNSIPNLGVVTDTDSEAGSKRDRFKAGLDFHWVNASGESHLAPNAQLILYPKYPEVRMSGFLARCSNAPSEQMTSRNEGRLLFLGIRDDDRILGHLTGPDNPIGNEIKSTLPPDNEGIFFRLPIDINQQAMSSKKKLLSALYKIHEKGWIDSVRLDAEKKIMPCRSSNCGGYTLEAMLGITPNGSSDPDYLGWEVKQHGVKNLNKPHNGGPITLMTPEPTSGLYTEKGIEYFIREFGYPDKNGIPDRLNFGGIYKNGQRVDSTGLTLCLEGYNPETGKITNTDGGIKLLDDTGRETAIWKFTNMMSHWNRKHAKAVYIPSLIRKDPQQQYCYGSLVDLGEGTDFLMFLRAINSGLIYYDPGIKLENASHLKPKIKRRSQFRIKSKQVGALYKNFTMMDMRSIDFDTI